MRDKQAATEFFTTATKNLQDAGERAGVRRIVVVSIINTDRLKDGYSIAKVAHEQAMLTGPIPARVVRAAQFHEFVEQLVQWGTQGDVAYVPTMRTQLVAARTVAEALADRSTAKPTSPAFSFPARMPDSAARPSRSGWTSAIADTASRRPSGEETTTGRSAVVGSMPKQKLPTERGIGCWTTSNGRLHECKATSLSLLTVR